jgi:hypothetical protein
VDNLEDESEYLIFLRILSEIPGSFLTEGLLYASAAHPHKKSEASLNQGKLHFS